VVDKIEGRASELRPIFGIPASPRFASAHPRMRVDIRLRCRSCGFGWEFAPMGLSEKIMLSLRVAEFDPDLAAAPAPR
jgi:hypothetical protein